MRMEIEMPLTGDWIDSEKRAVGIKPLTLPFSINFRSDKVSIDVDKGTGIYLIEIDDADLTPSLRARLMAFAEKPAPDKRKEIAESGIKGHTHGVFRKLKENDNGE